MSTSTTQLARYFRLTFSEWEFVCVHITVTLAPDVLGWGTQAWVF